jgi:pyruvate,orthophosphate dikinase
MTPTAAFVNMYGDVVLGVQGPSPTRIMILTKSMMDKKKEVRKGINPGHRAEPPDELKELVGEFKELVKERTGKPFPEEPMGSALGRHRRGLRLLE